MNTHHIVTSDKRDVADVFRERMNLLIDQRGQNLSHFAKDIGLDRSALSQFLAPGSTRLPRAETLHAISRICGVSLDWLLGLIAIEQSGSEPTLMLEMKATEALGDNQLLLDWHKQATGYKIRYVPATLPDLLRTEAVSNYEFSSYSRVVREEKERQSEYQLTYLRRPETDMEVCMPIQTLESFANGDGIWKQIPVKTRRDQLETMIELLDEMYPTLRLFLYDECQLYTAPYTVFGPKRAAIYMGNLYLVVNSVEHIQTLTRHFDNLIRIAKVGPDRVANQIKELLSDI